MDLCFLWQAVAELPLECLDEYNELAGRYNKLIDDKAELERKNREKDYEMMYQQEHSRSIRL